ncbi:MAG: hypothetical protein N2595_07375, partial [bacterium]|nr:hypothetical protein [bacterium]
VYSSLNPLSLVACGSIAPGLNSTNFPPYLHHLARAALALALDDLHRTLLDPDGLPILKYYAANAWAGYDVGWLYAWIAVPPQFTSDASRRLQALFHSTLRDLANSPALPAARARAIFDAQLALHSRNTLFDLIIQNYLFGYDKRLPLSYQTYLTNISPPQLSTFYSLYARFPVTIIVTPQ